MIKLIKTIIILVATFSSLPCIAQKAGDSFSKVYPTEKIKLKSSFAIDREYVIHITNTVDSIIPGKKYPVLYYTDAWLSAEYFNLMGSFLINSNEIEQVILVGISFDADINDFVKFRRQDLWPTSFFESNSIKHAKNFLEFIKKDLMPYVEQNYSGDPNDRGYFGYSLGGLFATWVLKEDPLLFKRIGIGSPSLQYKDYMLLKNQTLLNNINMIEDLKVFVEYGTLESEKQKSGAEAIYGLLHANEKIQAEKFILEGSHLSATPETWLKALTYLYAKKNESN